MYFFKTLAICATLVGCVSAQATGYKAASVKAPPTAAEASTGVATTGGVSVPREAATTTAGGVNAANAPVEGFNSGYYTGYGGGYPGYPGYGGGYDGYSGYGGYGGYGDYNYGHGKKHLRRSKYHGGFYGKKGYGHGHGHGGYGYN